MPQLKGSRNEDQTAEGRLTKCQTNNNPERCGPAGSASRWIRSSSCGSGRLCLTGGFSAQEVAASKAHASALAAAGVLTADELHRLRVGAGCGCS